MKKFLTVFFATVTCLLCACGASAPDEIKFTEFPQYCNFKGGTVLVEVTWDDGSGVPVEFVITDSEQVNSLTAMLKETKFIKSGTVPNDGGYSSVMLVDSENNKTPVHLMQIQYGNKNLYYSYAERTVYNYAKQVGEQLGYVI